MVKIPDIKGRGVKLKYAFDTVTASKPLPVKFKTPEQRKSIIAAAFNYSKRHDIKFACRTDGNTVTVYLNTNPQ